MQDRMRVLPLADQANLLRAAQQTGATPSTLVKVLNWVQGCEPMKLLRAYSKLVREAVEGELMVAMSRAERIEVMQLWYLVEFLLQDPLLMRTEQTGVPPERPDVSLG